MKHCMAIWTNWNEVVNRIHVVDLRNRSDTHPVMHMDKATTNFTVCHPEIDAAYPAKWLVVLYASGTSFSVALVCVHNGTVR
jgi:hypothetical protein